MPEGYNPAFVDPTVLTPDDKLHLELFENKIEELENHISHLEIELDFYDSRIKQAYQIIEGYEEIRSKLENDLITLKTENKIIKLNLSAQQQDINELRQDILSKRIEINKIRVRQEETRAQIRDSSIVNTNLY